MAAAFLALHGHPPFEHKKRIPLRPSLTKEGGPWFRFEQHEVRLDFPARFWGKGCELGKEPAQRLQICGRCPAQGYATAQGSTRGVGMDICRRAGGGHPADDLNGKDEQGRAGGEGRS